MSDQPQLDRFRVAAVQLVSTSDIERNLAAAARWVERAAAAGAKLVVLPEAFALFISNEQHLLGAIEATGARRVWVTHGYVAVLVRHLRENGIEAEGLETRFEGERDEPAEQEPGGAGVSPVSKEVAVT